MHPNVIRGNKIHSEHFKTIREDNGLSLGWEIYGEINGQIGILGLRPDWIIVNRNEKRAIIIDLTTKYSPAHYKKGILYKNELQSLLGDPAWEIIYLEDYWLDATYH